MIRQKLNLVALALCVLAMVSCSTSNNDEDVFTPRTYNVTGKVEKGPFVSGSTITIQPMDSELQVLGSMFNTTITDNIGNFTFGSKEFQTPYAEMMATGYFFNEVKGSLSEGTLVLRALVDLSDNSTVNVNILTHLKYPRIKKLIESGKSFKEANTQAQNELLKAFGLQKYASKDASQFSIISGTDESAALIAASSLLLYNRSEGALTEYLSALSQEFGNNGEFSETTKAQFKKDKAELTNKLNEVQSNVIRRYSELGMNVEVKDLVAYFDWDEDGTAGNESLKEGESVILDKTEISVPKEGGTYTIIINSPIPVYTQPTISKEPSNSPHLEVLYKDFYEGDDDIAPTLESSIENKALIIKVGASQLKREQNLSLNLYDALGHIVATVHFTIEGSSSSIVPLLGSDSKACIAGITPYLADAFSKYSYLEQLYFYNKGINKLPLSDRDNYIFYCWNDFFKYNSRLLDFKEYDAQRLDVYQDYVNVFYTMYYYTMVVAWGDVPYNFGNRWIGFESVPRESKGKVLSDLKTKLLVAIENLEEKKNQSTIDMNGLFFVSKDVARIVLANIYMYEGNWREAKPLLSKVRSNGYYQLDSSDDNDKSGNGVIFTLVANGGSRATRSSIAIKAPIVVPLQTISDVYLSSAECDYHLGNTSDASSLLLKVTTAKGITVSDNGITGIKEARAKLLLYNAGYFAFLKRNGLAKAECGIQDYQLLFPIPGQELGSNPSMTQNPGY